MGQTEKRFVVCLAEAMTHGANDAEYWENSPDKRVFTEIPAGASIEEVRRNFNAFFESRENRSAWGFHFVKDGETKSEFSQGGSTVPRQLVTVSGFSKWRHFEILEEKDLPFSAPRPLIKPAFYPDTNGEVVQN